MNVVVFGDSTANGQCVSPHLCWVTLLSAALTDALVVNVSVSGDTTRTALLRMAHDVPASDVLIVQFGLNDCNRWISEYGANRVSERAFAANLAEIADRSRSHNVVFIANHRTRRDIDYDVRAADYNGIIRTVARETGAGLVDMEAVPVPLLDGIHPSVTGHERYAATVLPAIQSLLG